MEAENARRDFEEKQEKLVQEKAVVEQEVSTLRQDSDQFKHGADALKNELNELEDKDRDLNFRLGKSDLNILLVVICNQINHFGLNCIVTYS